VDAGTKAEQEKKRQLNRDAPSIRTEPEDDDDDEESDEKLSPDN
jgi:hypothetical protein